MCQKIINGIAIFSGVVSLTVVGTAGYVYVQKDAIIESVKQKVVGNAIGGLAGGALKSLPVPGLAPKGSPLPVPGLPFGG
jgi:hypothetical protein|tara:strand:- start:515 stop:754 length:240 start_codon:yes stop_codon:yes gene_type:complete